RRDHVNEEAEAKLADELGIAFSFHVQFVQPGTRCEASCDQANRAIGHKAKIPGLLSQIERAPHHRGCGPDGLSPWQDMVADDVVDLAAKTREILSFHERGTEMTEAEPLAIVAEARTDRHAQLAER